MAIAVCDIGNTHAHAGLFEAGSLREQREWLTPRGSEGLLPLREWLAEVQPEALVFSSVVPVAAELIAQELGAVNVLVKRLTALNAPGLAFTYPHPAEVGGDRVANALGAQARAGLPCVVVGMGTATALDAITREGYAGGIIAPGLAVLTRYLHEKTALLPAIDHEHLDFTGAIGRSTVEAMRVGCGRGFLGMVRELTEALVRAVRALDGQQPTVIVTGGNARFLPTDWWPSARLEPDLSLWGLYEAWKHPGFA